MNLPTRNSKVTCRLVAGFLIAFYAAASLPTAQASTIRHDVADSYYTALGSNYSSSVGKISNYGDNTAGSGTIISIDDGGFWVLTAAHVVQDAGSASNLRFITSAGTTYSNVTSYTYNTYVTNSDLLYASTCDLGLMYVSSTNTSGLTAATLYTGTTAELIGETATYVGYGITGTGTTGADPKASPSTYGTLRAVQNVLDKTVYTHYHNPSYSDSVFLSDFDSLSGSPNRMGDPTQLDLEGLICSGDSGGGAFVTIGDTEYLAGVNSFGSYYSGDDRKLSIYGDVSGAVSVCDYIDWICDETGIVVPEPSQIVMLLGLFGMLLLRKRLRR